MKLAIGVMLLSLVLQSWAQQPGKGTSQAACENKELFRVHKVVGWSSGGGDNTFLFKSGFAIDADGAYKAYHPRDTPGIDALSHAGRPGNWWAIFTLDKENAPDGSGPPLLQKKTDPAPGYYISMTTLVDPKNPNPRDPHRYVDAVTVPYIALVPKVLHHAQLGDFATVINLENGKMAGAIVADETDPSLPLGEGSIALAKMLGIEANPRHGGIERKNVVYIVYPNSGNGAPSTPEEIKIHSEALFQKWGGTKRVDACLSGR